MDYGKSKVRFRKQGMHVATAADHVGLGPLWVVTTNAKCSLSHSSLFAGFGSVLGQKIMLSWQDVLDKEVR